MALLFAALTASLCAATVAQAEPMRYTLEATVGAFSGGDPAGLAGAPVRIVYEFNAATAGGIGSILLFSDGSTIATTNYFDQFIGTISTTAMLTVAGQTRAGNIVTSWKIVNAAGPSAGLDSMEVPQVAFPDHGGIRLDRFAVEFPQSFLSGTAPFEFDASDYTGLPALSLRYPDGSAAPLINPQLSASLVPADSDGDGLDDAADACPSSDLAPTVIIDGCNSHVDNALDANGCTISDRVADCADDARHHLGFTLCVGRLTLSLAKERVITLRDTAKILYCAVRADLP